MTQITFEQMHALETEIENTFFILIELELEEAYPEMNTRFAQLLATIQAANLIDYKLDVLVEPKTFGPETCTLLESLIEAKARPRKRHQLLTHRMILKVWLRKNHRFINDYLPQMF